MANMCLNVVEINGSKKDVKKFLKLVGKEFDFNKIIPLKDDSKAESSKNWGCNSIAFDTEIDDFAVNDGFCNWTFTTKWNAPDKIYKRLVELFPEVFISWRYEEPGNGLYGFLQNEKDMENG
jgi:hypothetical protein